MILIPLRNSLRLSRILKHNTAMPARASTRQAAVKANQAFAQGPAGSKRKGSAAQGPLTKKGKKEVKIKEPAAYEKPSVTEEAQETRPSEAWSDAQATVNQQPTEAPPQKAEEKAEEPITDGAVKEEEGGAKPPILGKRFAIPNSKARG